MESISVSKNSTRMGESALMGNTSTMPPRTLNCPTFSTSGTCS